MKALVVDDSRAMRRIVSNTMRQLGFEVEQAEHGRAALTVLEDQTFDVATIDWNMPTMNGLELVKAIRVQEKLVDMKLVMVTSETEIDRVMDALSEGADEYVMKPFTAAILREKLQMLGLLVPDAV